MQLTLRRATNRDREAIEALVFGVLEEYGLKPDPGATDSDLKDIELSYIARGGVFDVLTDESGQVVGSVGLFPVSSSVCELRKMYLAAPARGFGYGKRLLGHALDRARELGFGRVVLETASVLREVVAGLDEQGLGVRAVAPSALRGADGNVEFFVWARRGTATLDPTEIDRVVAATQEVTA